MVLYRVKVCWLVPYQCSVEDPHSHQQTRPSSAVAETLSVNTRHHHTTPQDTSLAMSEDHFDRWEYYNFEEKLVTSRNTGTFTCITNCNCRGVSGIRLCYGTRYKATHRVHTHTVPHVIGSNFPQSVAGNLILISIGYLVMGSLLAETNIGYN